MFKWKITVTSYEMWFWRVTVPTALILSIIK